VVWVLLVAVAVLVIVLFLGLLAGKLPLDRMSEPTHTTPGLALSESAGPADIDALRFDTALRGYRMDQVDEALALLRQRIADLEVEAASLREPE